MIKTINPDSKIYPSKIKSRILNSPILQVLGDTSFLEKNHNIAFIGSRFASTYGLNVAKSFIEYFKGYQINIISGLAPGIDSFCHNLALENNLITTGVLGFGFDFMAEFENYDLCKNIVNKHGCIISPFKTSQKPTKSTFIERNKIISALADILVVVEASVHSGAFYTVQSAVEFDVPVCVVPGDIFSKNSKGTHNLIKSGALLVDDPSDLKYLLKL